MTITTPTLPPKAGYVEVEVNGQRVYQNVETGELLGQETPEEGQTDDVWHEMAAAITEGVDSL